MAANPRSANRTTIRSRTSKTRLMFSGSSRSKSPIASPLLQRRNIFGDLVDSFCDFARLRDLGPDLLCGFFGLLQERFEKVRQFVDSFDPHPARRIDERPELFGVFLGVAVVALS